MRQTAIGFKTKGLSLEGVLTTPQDLPEPLPALLVCHPHPMLGGDIDNPVVVAICRAADDQGMVSFRFNFRGVGESEGEFSNGVGEQEDLKSALNVLRRWPGIDRKRLALVGYSFGASVVLEGLRHYKAASCLALVAPTISSAKGGLIRRDKRPKLFVVGERDGVVPSVELQRALDQIGPPAQFVEVPSADHSLLGSEATVAEKVVAFVKDTFAR